MGVFLFAALLAGIAAGLFMSGLLGSLAAFLISRLAARRRHVLRIFSSITILILFTLLYAVHSYPFPAARPGSDYDVAFASLFWGGLAYATALGAAAGLASIVTFVIPTAPQPQITAVVADTQGNTVEPPPLPLERPPKIISG